MFILILLIMQSVCVILYFLLVSQAFAQVTTNSEQQNKQDLSLNLELLQEMKAATRNIGLYSKRMDNMEERIETMYSYFAEERPCNCLDLMKKNFTRNGIHTIYIHDSRNFKKQKEIQVYCDMTTDGGGWLVFQRRKDGSESFYKTWSYYKNGFGNLKKEFWLGNEDLYQILNNCGGNQHQLRIELGDFSNNKRYAKYSTFNIGSSAADYKLNIGGYSGNAGDAMWYHNGYRFSTHDNDNDGSSENCASQYKGGWWFKSCHQAHLNGPYMNRYNSKPGEGIIWNRWTGLENSLKFTEMKLRPKQ